jgi:glycosyltransferase involved in cell wall biosynthesis
MLHGGVKIVVENIIRSFDYYPIEKQMLNVIEPGDQGRYFPPRKINHIKSKKIGVFDTIFSSKKEFLLAADEIAKDLEKKIDFKKFCVLHAHNINLFFNPALSEGLKILSKKYPKKLLVILQVHDFAEDNRPERLELLKTFTGKRNLKLSRTIGFPLTKNIIYFTINSRDEFILKKAGIPPKRVFYFPNALHIKQFNQKPIKDKELLNHIEKYANDEGYTFSKDRKILLYPVRVIKRKNIAEAILILKLLNKVKDEYQLLITLDSDIKVEDDYSGKIKEYVKNKQIPVTIGLGLKLISPTGKRKKNKNKEIIQHTLADLFYLTHTIISTSVIEGFGFVFLEGWITKKQVVGRKLDFVMRDFEKEGMKFPGFYTHLIIDGKDFSKHPIDKQLELLDEIDYEKLRKRKTIKKLIRVISNPNEKIIKENKKIVETKYSLRQYNSKLNEIIKIGKKLMKQELDENTSFSTKYIVKRFKQKNK